MASQDKNWLAEIDRRAADYDTLDEGGDDRLSGADYFGMAALAIVLTVVCWIWAV